MDARWIPVLAAALGVLGGVGGAAIGGSVANSGQEQRFESERQAAIEDLRRTTYARYQGAADVLMIKYGLELAALTKEASAEELEALTSVEEQLLELFVAGAAVELIADDQVVQAADAIRQDIPDIGDEEYEALRDDFIGSARNEIGSGE